MANESKTQSSWFTKHRVTLIVAALVAILAILYWDEHGPVAGPAVTYTRVQQKTVPVYLTYVGNTANIRTVDIRARVEGFLIDRAFIEGTDVHANDLIFTIDPKPFEAKVAKAKSQLAKDEAALIYAREQVERYRPLVEKDYVSREQFDDLVTQADKAAAVVEADQAALDTAKLNLSYCWMYAPFDGRIGRTYVHTGNLVGAGEATKLATINQLDPIYIYFSPSDEEAEKILTTRHETQTDPTVDLILPDGTTYPYSGGITFVDNKVDLPTSTVAMRATIPNPDTILLPGLYLKAKVHLKNMPDALLVPKKSVAEDQGGRYVLLITDATTAKKSYIESAFTLDDMEVITKGVAKGDRVIVDGMQLVRPGMPVVASEIQSSDGGGVRDLVHQAVGATL